MLAADSSRIKKRFVAVVENAENSFGLIDTDYLNVRYGLGCFDGVLDVRCDNWGVRLSVGSCFNSA